MPADLFARYRERHELAARRAGELVRTYAIAGRRVRVSHAGGAVAEALGRALAPLRTADDVPADVTIHASDSVSSDTPMVGPGWTQGDFGRPRGHLETVGEGLHAAYHLGSGVLSMFDEARGEGLWWTRDVAELPGYEQAAPMRAIVHHLVAGWGLHLVHGAGVAGAAGAALVAARGGSGKSTTAVASLLAGLGYLGDDYTLASVDPAELHLLYATAKLADAEAARFPALARCAGEHPRADGEKLVLHVGELHPERLVRSAPLTRLLVPRFADRDETRAVPAPPAAVLKALAPSTIFQQPGAGEASLRFLGALVRRVPGFFLELGRDRAAVPVALRALLGNE